MTDKTISIATFNPAEMDWFPPEEKIVTQPSMTTVVPFSSLSSEQVEDLAKSVTYSGESLKTPSVELQDIEWWKATKFANLVEQTPKGEIVFNFSKTGESDINQAIYAMSMATKSFLVSEENAKVKAVEKENNEKLSQHQRNVSLALLRRKRDSSNKSHIIEGVYQRKQKRQLARTIEDILKKKNLTSYEKGLLKQHQQVVQELGEKGANYVASKQFVMNFGK